MNKKIKKWYGNHSENYYQYHIYDSSTNVENKKYKQHTVDSDINMNFIENGN